MSEQRNNLNTILETNLPKILAMTCAAMIISGCSKTASDPLCNMSEVSAWNANNSVIAGITAPGRVHGTDFKFQHKGEILGEFACVPDRIWCPEPDNDKGCQLFTCQGTADAGTVIRIMDADNVSYFKADQQTPFRWNGQALRCPS